MSVRAGVGPAGLYVDGVRATPVGADGTDTETPRSRGADGGAPPWRGVATERWTTGDRGAGADRGT
ncbi:hypothetical protein ACM9HB_35475, partial [Streptomyces sp. JAC128]|uniref:hypothetical protein n=1 Tax=Streptomyces sp. JAC128 TaxID=3418412 RepID=UPI003D814442